MEISKNEMGALKILFTDYTIDYNAYSLREKLGISSVGSLKLLKKMKEKNLLKSKTLGNATFYKVNTENSYAMKLLELGLLDNGRYPTFIKGWLQDLKQFEKDTKAVLLFGSILTKGRGANDVDVCFILGSHDDYKKVQQKISLLNEKNRQKIHPLFLTENDTKNKLNEHDTSVIDMVRTCLVVHGHELFVRVLRNVQGS